MIAMNVEPFCDVHMAMWLGPTAPKQILPTAEQWIAMYREVLLARETLG